MKKLSWNLWRWSNYLDPHRFKVGKTCGIKEVVNGFKDHGVELIGDVLALGLPGENATYGLISIVSIVGKLSGADIDGKWTANSGQ